MQATKAQVQQAQRSKLANSYQELLDEFSSKDLRNVGNYTLGRLIGKGSFGKVYLATHKLTNGSKVVLKSAKKDDSNLAREIHHHRQFIHPHIARLYEVIVTENLVWLVLEYCSGDELYNHLLKTGPMEPAKVQKIFTQLVGAVSYVHQKSCVHRDLKLENILLDKNENVKLVDFGFTREYEGKSSYLQTWCGTVCYSAPEMLKGEKYAGEKVDVWSLGIILYALLCGELPFDEDEEEVTKRMILRDDPKYPEHIPLQAKDLISLLLSKRTLLRPSLADILQHPWLAEHAPQQQAILKLQQPAPFTTELEKETLQRMRSAGVDIDIVIENVLAQRCDSLAGWWALLLEKEERKAKRRERKRKERDAEKSLRRLSAASSRLERLAPTIRELDEEHLSVPTLADPPRPRGRNLKRNSSTGTSPSINQLHHFLETLTLETEPVPPLPKLSESPKSPPPPQAFDKDSRRSGSTSRPPPPPKERRMSMLQHVQTNPDLLSQSNGVVKNRRRTFNHPILNQLASLKHWFKESAKRTRSPNALKSSVGASGNSSSTLRPIPNPRRISHSNSTYRYSNSHIRPELAARATFPQNNRAVVSTPTTSVTGGKRPSLSPAPLTPHSSYRRSSHGLRGRKSTSSSVSSIRSIHHHQPTHSKASSTSSTTTSVASPTSSSTMKVTGRSPHNSSVKVLPATPTTTSFPSSIRIGRHNPNLFLNNNSNPSEGGAAFSALPPPSPGLAVFAKRKRSVFKGPMLNIGGHHGGSPSTSRVRGEGSRSGSVQGRRSGEVIVEEEEDEDEEDIEEVDDFSPEKDTQEEFLVEEPVAIAAAEDSHPTPSATAVRAGEVKS
ncbi:kinase-like protein [Tothia fuscella]|uniref:Kinase-like protein n=1 Tax=Tothia fuscella TaxID=1048955 RepID=A0A9P4U314_9PEZI|nr:kinase-like protein [Tothia fuscella]